MAHPSFMENPADLPTNAKGANIASLEVIMVRNI